MVTVARGEVAVVVGEVEVTVAIVVGGFEVAIVVGEVNAVTVIWTIDEVETVVWEDGNWTTLELCPENVRTGSWIPSLAH